MKKTRQPRQTLRTTATHWGTYLAKTEKGVLKELRPWSGDSAPSPIAKSVPGALRSKARLAFPVAREGWLKARRSKQDSMDTRHRGSEPFVRISWDEAFALVADELQHVKTTYRNEGIYAGSYGWGSAGIFHHPQSQLHRFLNLFGGSVSSRNAYSFAAAEVVVPYVTGHVLRPLQWSQTTWGVIAKETELFVAFGGLAVRNSQVSPGGVLRHVLQSGVDGMLGNKGRLVDIGPIASDLKPSNNIEWVPLTPHTDVAVMLGIAYTLAVEELVDRSFLATHCEGYDEFERYLLGQSDGLPKSAAWASRITGLDRSWIVALAQEMARKRTMIGLSWSIQRADHGEQAIWMGITLAAMLGQIGLPGGGFGIGYGSCNFVGSSGPSIPWATLPKGFCPIEHIYIPVARISDMLLNPGKPFTYDCKVLTYPRAELIYWVGGNPFHHHQDLNRLIEAWRKPRTIIVHEPWWNASARHADLVLPAKTPFERQDFMASPNEEGIVAMHQVAEPFGESLSDYEIFSSVAQRLGFGKAFTEERTEFDWIRHLYEQSRERAADMGIKLPSFKAFWQKGVHELPPRPAASRVLLQAFRADPKGNPLATPSGKIEIFSSRIAAAKLEDCRGHAAWFAPREWRGSKTGKRFRLHLISSQPKGRLHSQYDSGVSSRREKIRSREKLRMNPSDAAARGVRTGQVVRVFNERGACLAGVETTDQVMPGVVQLSVGAWYDPLQPGATGSLDKHGNPNVLTRDAGTSGLAQGPSAMSCLVEVEPWTKRVPAITAFGGPTLASWEDTRKDW